MSKRKRSSDVEDDDGPGTDFRKQRQIAATFADSAKQLARAFKAAKGFERQKLGRRKKNAVAAKDTKDVERIDAEVAALKTLDNTVCAEHYLAKSVLKIKAVATSPHLPPFLGRPKALPSDASSLNVNARLCNSNPVKEAFPTAIAAVKREFGIKDDPKAGSKKRRLRAKDFDITSHVRSASFSSSDNAGIPLPRKSVIEQRSKGKGEASEEAEDDSVDDMQQYRARLATSDDSEDEPSDFEEASDLEDLEQRLLAEGIPAKGQTPQGYDLAADLSLSEVSDDESVDEKPRKTTAPKKSAFIPSLTMGGYISGSGSEAESYDDVAPAKNRRGQRARQKIWELKYGKRAAHLQNQQRDQGWDPKRGAVDGRGGKGKGANSMPLGRARSVPTGRGKKSGPAAPAAVKPKPRKDDSGALHPSWEAAKRAKEKKNAPVAFQGKKISFD